MDINYNYLHVFQVVARYGNLTMAAKELLVSQPSVSLTIQKLELALGVRLFERQTKGMVLTSEGLILQRYVDDGFGIVDDALLNINSERSQRNGVLRIAGNQSIIATRILGQAFRQHRKVYPFTHIRVYESCTSETVHRLSAGLSDVAFLYTPQAIADNLIMELLATTDAVFIVGEELRFLTERGTLDISELLKYPLISFSGSGQGRYFWSEIFSRNGIIPNAEYDVSSTAMMLSAVKQNLGIGLILRQSAEISLEQGHVFELKTTLEMPTRDICMVYPKGDREPHIQAFIDSVVSTSKDRETFA